MRERIRDRARKAQPLRACAAACLAACLVLAGCREAPDLVEVVYTQDAQIVDETVAQKKYQFDPSAADTMATDETSDDLADVAHERVEQTIPVFGVPPVTDEAVDQVFYDQNSGISRTAPIFPDRPTTTTDDVDLADDVSWGGADDGDDEGQSDGDDGAVESDEAVHGVSMHSDAPKAYNASGGLLAPLEDVQLVATVGEYANLALMLGGPGTLVAADDSFLHDDGTSRVFGDGSWGFSQIAPVWAYDAAHNTYTCDFEALKAASPDLVWVPDGVGLLDDDQRAELLEMGVHVEPAPAMDSVRAIKEMARWLGSTLADHTAGGRDAGAAATTYVQTFLGDDIESLIRDNGGLATYGGVDYSGERHTVAPETTWCLLVTDWDDRARFDWAGRTYEGVAIARAGWGWSPANFYLSAGGANNNAAQFPVASMAQRSSGDYYVWQFNMSMLDPSKVEGYRAVASFGETSYGWTQCLVGAPATADRDAVFETSLGADDFRYVICTTRAAADALRSARDEGTAEQAGLYAAYDYNVGAALQESGVGPRTADGVLIRAVIGSVGKAGGEVAANTSLGQLRAAAGENPYEVVTCGSGLYCDWVAGSAESFLLAFWCDCLMDAADGGRNAVTADDVDFTPLDDEARRFYQEFYLYDLDDEDLLLLHEGRAE